MSKTLFITNDFPPRPGGIQTFVYEIVSRFNPESVVVLTSDWTNAKDFDAGLDYKVVRAKTKVLLPTKKTLGLAAQLIAEHNIDQIVFGASAPLGLLAKPLRKFGIKKIVAFTHGHEVGWAKTPITKGLLRRIAKHVDSLTYLTAYTKSGILKGLPKSTESKMYQLLPGVDAELFNPRNKIAGKEIRAKLGFADRPTIVSVSRLMARKGHDQLIKALPEISKSIPGVALVIVGEGKNRKSLEKLVRRLNLTGDVYFSGKVPYSDLPKWYAVGDIFAMPCRTRLANWDVEGLGIVYLEASATGLPVVAGDSGGAPEAVIPGKTGFVVGGRDIESLVKQLIELLKDEDLRLELGQNGRDWVSKNWTWDKAYQELETLLRN